MARGSLYRADVVTSLLIHCIILLTLQKLAEKRKLGQTR